LDASYPLEWGSLIYPEVECVSLQQLFTQSPEGEQSHDDGLGLPLIMQIEYRQVGHLAYFTYGPTINREMALS
jgi:hypothetical protein